MENEGVYKHRFKARPVPKSNENPFQVAHQNKAPTQPKQFHLHTEQRSGERAAYEREQQRRRAIEENKRFMDQLAQLEREREEVKQARAATVFKALPLPTHRRV